MNRSAFTHEIRPTEVDMKCVAATQAQVGESPTWSAIERSVYFIDILGQTIHRYEVATKSLTNFQAPQMVTSVAPRRAGGLVASTERGLAFFNQAMGSFEHVADVKREPVGNRFNDGKCDPRGDFWAGTMSQTEWDAPVGCLYRFGADLTPQTMRQEVRCSNGLAWSPDKRTFYYVESFAHTIHAFDYDIETGAISNRRLFATVDPASGAFPDGLTVDAEGYVWSAQPVFGRLVRYAPDGFIDQIVESPVSRCTSCCFGGDDLATLYITSARQSLSFDQLREEPLAGGLFAFQAEIGGVAETPFVG
jgi:L-arabinonolactonase